MTPDASLPEPLQALIDEATYDYAMGDSEAALAKLGQAIAQRPDCFDAWHALAEVNFSLRRLDAALEAGEKAHRLKPGEPLVSATLSRIWMERGDKAKAEHFGAQARMQSWRKELKNPPEPGTLG